MTEIELRTSWREEKNLDFGDVNFLGYFFLSIFFNSEKRYMYFLIFLYFFILRNQLHTSWKEERNLDFGDVNGNCKSEISLWTFPLKMEIIRLKKLKKKISEVVCWCLWLGQVGGGWLIPSRSARLGLTIYHNLLSLPDSQNLANNTLPITNLNNLTGAKTRKNHCNFVTSIPIWFWCQ